MICLAQMYQAQREILPVWVYQEAEIRAPARDPRFRGDDDNRNILDAKWIKMSPIQPGSKRHPSIRLHRIVSGRLRYPVGQT